MVGVVPSMVGVVPSMVGVAPTMVGLRHAAGSIGRGTCGTARAGRRSAASGPRHR